MKIGTVLTLENKQPHTNEVKKYRCKVIEKNEYYLFIDLPIELETSKTAFLPKGTSFLASYVGKDQSVYKFYTELVAKVKLNVPAIALHIPNESDLIRMQRREYVRIETAVDVAIHGSQNSFTAVTFDISGGGMSVIIPSGMKLAEKEEVNAWIVLSMHDGDYQYVNVLAEVIRVTQDGASARVASLKFASITKPVQQNIIRYCFEKQREARKKELL